MELNILNWTAQVVLLFWSWRFSRCSWLHLMTQLAFSLIYKHLQVKIEQQVR